MSCTSTPKSRGYQNFVGATDEIHTWMRESESKTYQSFPNMNQVRNHVRERFTHSDCYLITEATTQWGLFEPEVFMEAKGHFSKKTAWVFAPPLLDEQRAFPTPAVPAGTPIFRIDQDAPHGPETIRALQNLVGDKTRCVQFDVIESKGEEINHVIVASRILRVDTATAPQSEKKPAPKKVAPKKQDTKKTTPPKAEKKP
ncbi:MAG: hypothetical protein CL678_03510 [Bdellovibrionaceae bacterium]|nr:hypothetical protein [Pseudobdellovibrionaceae bacterium]